MKFLILGCNGMAGHTVSIYLKEQGHSVFGFDMAKSPFIDSIAGNALDTGLLCDVIGKNKFDSIINCIGLLNRVCDENKAAAVFLNSYLPHFLAQTTDGTDTQVIHMSTDCVFSGKRGEYTEDDIPDGETFYDRTKALGELCDGENVTLRGSIIGPDINPRGIGLLNWFMQQQGEINGYTGAVWTGQTTLQLAKTMEAAAYDRAAGLYNTVPNNSINKYELLQLMNRYLRGGSIKINPVEGVSADKSLKRTRFDFGYKIPDYETMMAEQADWIAKHKELYPHYHL